MSSPKKIVVGISGASGAPYAKRLLEILRDVDVHVGVVLSKTAEEVWREEITSTEPSVREMGFEIYEGRDYHAPFASGSAQYEAMVVIPASMSSIARIAHGISDDLLTRAADVILKERRKLLLVARESPFSATHLRNMLTVSEAGAVVIPANPSFYSKPSTLEAAIDTVVARVLDHLGIGNTLQPRWKTPT